MGNNSLSYTENIALQWINDINEADKHREAFELIFESAMEIEKDSGGKPTKIIFTVGGPYVYLDLFCNPGSIVVYFDGHEVKKKISKHVLEQIEFELEGLGYDS